MGVVEPYVVVTGNIAVGKTSLLREIQATTGARCHCEIREPAVSAYFAEPTRRAFIVQLLFMLQYVEHAAVATEDPSALFVQERSIHDAAAVFGALRVERGWIDQHEVEAIARVERIGGLFRCPSAFVLLDAEPAVLLKRIRDRQAPGEEYISIEDLQDLRDRYNQWYDSLSEKAVRVSTVGRTPAELVETLRPILFPGIEGRESSDDF